MKIKKVEIQAFRAFNRVEDGTFDFSINEDMCAEFISIYAPNGFGKTSFYDAVEWAYTNKISRFDRKKGFNYELAKSERSMLNQDGERKHQWIIRNKFSDVDVGFVNLYTTSSELPYSNIIPDVKRGEPDYKFDNQERNPNTDHFEEVLLSQEFIDAFLKEDNSTYRYQKFIDSFGDKELDKKYKIIIDLINLNKSRIKEKRALIETLNSELKMDFDKDILSKINTAINSVIQRGEKLEIITPLFSETDNLALSDQLSDGLIDLDKSIFDLKENIEILNKLNFGSSEDYVGIDEYYENKEEIIKLHELLSQSLYFKKLIEEKSSKTGEIESLRQHINKCSSNIGETKELIKSFPTYYTTMKKIGTEEEVISAQRKLLEKTEEQLRECNRKEDKLQSHTKSTLEEFQNKESMLNGLPAKFISLSKKKEEHKETETDLGLALQSINEKQTLVNEKRNLLNRFEQSITSIKKSKYPLNDTSHITSCLNEIDELAALENRIADAIVDTEKLSNEIKQSDSLNNDIKKLVEIGSMIVDRNELSSCPLCSNKYENYSQLSKKISDNDALQERIRSLLIERKKLENIHSELLAQKDTIQNKLITFLNKQVEDILKRINLEENSLASLNNKKVSLENKLKEISLAMKELEASLLGYSEHEVTNLIKIHIDSNTTEMKKQNLAISEVKDIKNRLNADLVLIKNKIDTSIKEIENLKKNAEFQKVLGYHSSSSIDSITIESLDSLLSDEELQLSKTKDNLKQLQNRISELKNIPNNIKENEQQIVNLQTKISTLKKSITKFESSLSKYIEIVSFDILKAALKKLIADETLRMSNSLIEIQQRKIGLEKIREYKDHIIPFLTHEKKSLELNSEKQTAEFLINVVEKELINAKNSLIEIINKQIETFFYQDLINTLYSKVDPHPMYKKISFKCDFSDDKPKLNIFVTEDNNSITPSLYFSTAQLNILSMSIFLAKALHVKDNEGNSIDCIFIDDPIQSMDSINILSTIDLLRSIVVNLNKQIILSTHDDNFQSLLKKKMPEHLFKAKYIELETFGKVKNS